MDLIFIFLGVWLDWGVFFWVLFFWILFFGALFFWDFWEIFFGGVKLFGLELLFFKVLMLVLIYVKIREDRINFLILIFLIDFSLSVVSSVIIINYF